jgi:thiol-disulfide isomerase/thioredoxin
MTIASLLLALIAATGTPSSDAADLPVLLDFHAEWCGPCRQVRPAVEQLIRKGYPVKSIDIDKDVRVATKYGVDRVPTFVVIDAEGRELDRSSGPQSASALAKFYLAAKAKAQPPDQSNAHADADDESGDREAEEPPRARSRTRRDDPDDRPEPEAQRSTTAVNPHPAETVVRIKVLGPNSTGFGSGTLIHSTPDQSLILTCAHIFKLEGNRQQAPPKRFPRKIVIDLFDGKMQGTKVGYLESFEGEAVDYDFTRDVGLIRIRPGRKLPYSRVVPAHWEPKSKPLPMKMLTLGCSGGADATAWYTKILNPRIQGLTDNPAYEAIECLTAPKEGRSGGGLFTTDYYVAGVCNFAEPRGNHGLYATPRSIYYLLDRNKLTALYAPVTRGAETLVADNRSPAAAPPPRARRALTPIARSQSPDAEEPDARRTAVNPEDLTLPHPSLLGIADPVVASSTKPASQTASVRTKRIAWQPIPSTPAPAAVRSPDPTDLESAPASEQDQAGSTGNASTTKSRWRPVKAAAGDRDATTPGN